MFIYYVIACPELWKKSVGRNGYNDFCMFFPVFAASRSPNIQYYSIEVIKNNSGIYFFTVVFYHVSMEHHIIFFWLWKALREFHCFSFFHMFIIISYNRTSFPFILELCNHSLFSAFILFCNIFNLLVILDVITLIFHSVEF